MGVCDLVIGAGGDEDNAIGALFHDLAEDKGGEKILLEIRGCFNGRVERIVRDCSDTIPSDYTQKEPWVDRKVAHLQHIQSGMKSDSCCVLAADTLHNTRDHIRGFRANDMDWWNNFRATVYTDRQRTPEIGAASALWYIGHKYECLNFALRDNPNPLLPELLEAYNILKNMQNPEVMKQLYLIKEYTVQECKWGFLMDNGMN
jgi:hypothetical protein